MNAITAKNFDHQLLNAIRGFSAARTRIQHLVLFAGLYYAGQIDGIEGGDTGYLSKIAKAVSETGGVQAQRLIDYITDHSNVAWNKDKSTFAKSVKGSDPVFQIPTKNWYEWKTAPKVGVTDLGKELTKLQAKIEAQINGQTAKGETPPMMVADLRTLEDDATNLVAAIRKLITQSAGIDTLNVIAATSGAGIQEAAAVAGSTAPQKIELPVVPVMVATVAAKKPTAAQFKKIVTSLSEGECVGLGEMYIPEWNLFTDKQREACAAAEKVGYGVRVARSEWYVRRDELKAQYASGLICEGDIPEGATAFDRECIMGVAA